MSTRAFKFFVWTIFTYIGLLCCFLFYGRILHNFKKHKIINETRWPQSLLNYTWTLNNTYRLEPRRPLHCPQPIIIQHPNKAIINEIITSKAAQHCLVNVKAGRIEVLTEYVTFEQVEKELGQTVQIGGRWSPRDCRPGSRVAILVPYKNRKPQLAIFLRHIHPFLQRQNISYQIFVVEQNSEHLFNKGATVNAGFYEIMRHTNNYNCFVIHDVDQLPEDDRIWYRCAEHPRHLVPVYSSRNYKPPKYRWLFGGAVVFTKYQYERVNGFSNAYFGWGGEDDDLSKRKFYMKEGLKLYKNDGLNSIHNLYKLDSYEEYKLYTHVLVSFNETLIKHHIQSLLKATSLQ